MAYFAQISAQFPFGVGVFVALFGAVLGSFISMASHRLPLAEPMSCCGRSRCVTCGNVLGVRDLIPLLSWLFMRGRCRHCKARVSIRYLLIEASCSASCVLLYMYFGLTPQSLCLMALALGSITLCVTDLEHRIILDEVQILLFFTGIAYGLINDVAMTHLFVIAMVGLVIGLSLSYGALYFLGKEGLGFGDVKFLVVAGVWLASASPSWVGFVPFLFYSGLLGILSALLWRLVSRDAQFPFGPALALSLLVCVIHPNAIAQFFLIYGLLPIGHNP
jgi:leader peptidase (prepilin peptidase)/N-methyltransferase